MSRDDVSFVPRRKFRKKLKKHEGQNWDQSDLIAELEAAKRKNRKYCRTCHRYQPWSKLEVRYEKLSKRWIQQVWYCHECGDALHTLDINVRPKKKRKKSP